MSEYATGHDMIYRPVSRIEDVSARVIYCPLSVFLHRKLKRSSRSIRVPNVAFDGIEWHSVVFHVLPPRNFKVPRFFFGKKRRSGVNGNPLILN